LSFGAIFGALCGSNFVMDRMGTYMSARGPLIKGYFAAFRFDRGCSHVFGLACEDRPHTGCDCHLALINHRISRVDREIEERLLQLITIGPNISHAGIDRRE
jgi:hypothetical protein